MGSSVSSLFVLARAALPKRGDGGQLPECEARTTARPASGRQLQRYRQVCGLRHPDPRLGNAPLPGALPLLFPHLAAFSESLRLMARRDFPYPLPGLVHVANEVERVRRIDADEPLAHRVWFGASAPHPKGVSFPVHAEVTAGGEPVWRSVSTYLRRTGSARPAPDGGAGGLSIPDEVSGSPDLTRQWRAPANTGRTYGAVSGDRNPIHLHPLTARAFGFPRAIAHGMWTKAYALAALDQARPLPDAVRVQVAFRAPVLLPSTLRLAADRTGDGWLFEVRDVRGGRLSLRGELSAG